MSILTRWGREEIEQHYASGGWTGETYVDLLDRAAREHPDRLAVADDRARLTYAELQTATERLAGLLHAAGIGREDVVVAQLPNRVEFAILGLACAWLEAPVAPLVPGTGAAQVANVISQLGARAHASLPGVGEPPAAEALAGLVRMGPGLTEEEGIDLDPARLLARAPLELPPRPSADAVVDLMMTSGTTGAPKAIINTANTKLAGLRPFVTENGFDGDDVWAIVPPMVHNAGWLYCFVAALATGAPSILLERWRPRDLLDAIERERVTALFVAPTHAVDILAALREAPADVSSLTTVLLGAAPSSDDLRQAIIDGLGVRLVLMYGLTETQASNFTRPDDPSEIVLKTVGRACPGVEVGLLDADGRRVADGEVGEVAVRGPNVFGGYYDNQPATSESFTRDNWFRTGDLGRLLEDGSLALVGRAKEVIMRAGRGVVPDEVEEIVGRLAEVTEISVVGVSDPRLGEAVCACIVFDGPPLDRDAISSRLAAVGIGRDLWPDRVLAMDELPHTPVGKVARAKVRELVADAASFAGATVTPT